jgi:hypothetical protein|nr:MAG TPA: hypothetical protein [Caudoviricetes sp.]
MKLTITTLVIIEDTTDLSVPEKSICYHSFFEDIEKAKKEIINDVNKVYHLTANNPNPIHLITNPGILYI